MNYLTIVLCLISSIAFSSPSLPSRPDNSRSKAPTLESVSEIEVFEGKPGRTYTLISPISADKPSMDKAFLALKQKAQKMGAKAIIDYSCTAGEEVKTGLLKIRTANTDSVCSGQAVKWK